MELEEKEPLHLQVFRKYRLQQARDLTGDAAAAIHDVIIRIAAGEPLQDVPGPVLALASAFATYPDTCLIIADKTAAFRKKSRCSIGYHTKFRSWLYKWQGIIKKRKGTRLQSCPAPH